LPAITGFAPMQKAASDIILVWDWCGLGFHRSPEADGCR
jgi:hypothetical protein